MNDDDKEVNIACPKCFEFMSFAEAEDFYECPKCREVIITDRERFQREFKKAIRRVYGDKPEKPELN